MRLLVFGKNGQVARTLAEEASGAHDVVALGRNEADIARAGTIGEAVRAHTPNVIVNAAAYTAVEKAENEREAARALNSRAPQEMAEAAQEAGAAFIHLSTDYVFDGRARDPYREDTPTAPLNVYGETKRDGEAAVLGANGQAVVLRTSWVFSEYGNNFVKTMLRLANDRERVDVVSDQTGGPTPARDIARAVLAIAGKKHRGAPGTGVYHYQGAPAVSWAEFAKEVFEYSERSVDVRPVRTSDFPAQANRPRFTVLDCARVERDFGLAQPDWRIGLRQVLAVLDSEDAAS